MKKTKKLSTRDLDLLNEVQQNESLTTRELADLLNISSVRCSQILRELRENNYILGKPYILNPSLLDLNTLAFVAISLHETRTSVVKLFTSKILNLDNVLECYRVGGEHDFLLKIRLPSSLKIEDYLDERINSLKQVKSARPVVVLSEIKNIVTLPLDHLL